jgi:hypothetical protein
VPAESIGKTAFLDVACPEALKGLLWVLDALWTENRTETLKRQKGSYEYSLKLEPKLESRLERSL